MPSTNQFLKDLPVYQPGRPIKEVARELGLAEGQVAKLASNENPLGPSPLALTAMRQALENVNLYPDGNASYLKEDLSAKLRVDPRQIIVGNGSSELIEIVGHAFLGPGTNVVVSDYSFAMYPIVAKLFGADVVSVPAIEYGSDISGMLAKVTDKTRVVFVANPNNPTGTRSSAKEIASLINGVPLKTLLVIDEAYIEYLEDPQDLLSLVRSGSQPNLFLMRTFSKIHGLAGLRMGYGLGSAELVGELNKIRQPFNGNSVAQAAAIAALADEDHVVRSRQHNLRERERYETYFRERGWSFVPSAANFVLLRVGDGAGVFESLLKRGIITRPMGGYQLGEWLRVSVGKEAENTRCLNALNEILS